MLVAVKWTGPHPDALCALLCLVRNLEALAREAEEAVEETGFTHAVLAHEGHEAHGEVALCDYV